MAGIMLIYRHKQLKLPLWEKIESIQKNSDGVSVLYKNETFVLLKKGKENYPVQVIDRQDYTLVIEGKIYGVDVFNNDNLFRCSHEILFNKNKDESLHHLRSLDGEFVVYLINKSSKKIVVVNDYLGRLPLYYIQSDHFIIGRDIGLIHKLSGGLEFSDDGVYQYMRLGYPLGNKTLFKNLNRLPPSSFIQLDKKVSIQNQTLSLLEWRESGRRVKNPEQVLYELFKQAVKDRLDAFERPVLSLSGGLDSRIIMGEIEKDKQSVAYESFLYDHAIIQSDVKIAEQLGEFYNRQVGITTLEEWSPQYFDELISAKFGMNYLGMAFIIPFLKKMSAKYDLMLTGDGGDKTLAYLFPGIQLFTPGIDTRILRANEITTKSTCVQLCKFDTNGKEEALLSHLNGYPYADPKINYKHFLLFERTNNWLFEGEDRNRQYIWSTSPFYHPEFFKVVHSINENEKKNFQLYHAFTSLIDPELNKISNANWGFSIRENAKLKKLIYKQHVKQYVKLVMPRVRTAKQTSEKMKRALNNQLSGKSAERLGLKRNFNISELSQESIFHVLTLLKVAESMERK